MYSLIAFASQWGSKYGGINCFNTDFLEHFSAAYALKAQIVCIVTSATDDEIAKAKRQEIRLISLNCSSGVTKLNAEHAPAAIHQLEERGIAYVPSTTIWLGHDLITGGAAIAAAKQAGGRSAAIHHMSYDHYESFAEDSATAYSKNQDQTKLFKQADLVLAVGPLLRDAVTQKVDSDKTVHMLIPGLADLEPRDTPKTFSAFLSGRLSDDAAPIKQGHLGIAAFARSHKQARKKESSNGLDKQPKLLIRGVNFEAAPKDASSDPEKELKQFAEKYADAVINLHALPYTQDRATLYDDLCGSTVAMMPSWHEGFGLVAWEAISAGVPLILGKNSGVYRLLEEEHPGTEKGFVYPVDVRGSTKEPFFHNEDLKAVSKALTSIANNLGKAKKQAASLRDQLSQYTWANCAEEAMRAFGWSLQKGSIPQSEVEVSLTGTTVNEIGDLPSDSPLQIPQRQLHTGRPLTDSQLLRAEEALVPFDAARKPELDALNKWIDETSYPEAIRLITGAGGLGKTRLALELCQQRKAAGWQAGLLESELTVNEIKDIWLQLSKKNQPILIVIDYAETRQNSLLTLIKTVLDSPAQYPVRLLLLARDGGEWWDNLAAKDSRCESLLSGYATSGPYVLPPLYREAAQRQIAYQQALGAFAETLNVIPPKISPNLTADYFGRPLYLQMAALLALHGEQTGSAQGLTNALLNHEYRYWQGLFKYTDIPDAARHAQQLLSLATLTGGYATVKEALSHWKEINGALLSHAQFDQIFKTLSPLYPGKQGLQAIRPDLLGEALVARTLIQSKSIELLNTVLGKHSQRSIRSHALTVLARLTNQYNQLNEILVNSLSKNLLHCCIELVAVSKETPSQLPYLTTMAFSSVTSAEQSQGAGMLEPLLEEESVELMQLNCVIKKYLVNKAEKKLKRKPRDIHLSANYAETLSLYSVALGEAGQNDKALVSGKQALDIYEPLVEKQPDLYRPDYSLSLMRYAIHLSNVGRPLEALEYNKKAVNIHSRLAEKQPGLHKPNYATSLSNYAGFLSDVGQFDEAKGHAEYALEICKRLAEEQPDCYELDYAHSLINYGLHLSEVGEFEDEIKHVKQALGIYKRLAEKQPDCYESSYALSLNNYSICLSNLGKPEDARKYAEKALEIRKRLVDKQPDRYHSDYANSLDCYASLLILLGKFDDAKCYSERALDIIGCLIDKQPDRHDADYATLLASYADCWGALGKFEKARSYAEQALLILKRLAESYPSRFSEVFFEVQCDFFKFCWLSNKAISIKLLSGLDNIFEAMPDHAQPLSIVNKNFVVGCVADDYSQRKTAFQQIVFRWQHLPSIDKVSAEEEFLCACAWCAANVEDGVSEYDWQARWKKYVKQRRGNISHEMQVMAERLGFCWPEFRESCK